jgi:ABC-type sugar transport system ATPase subunit
MVSEDRKLYGLVVSRSAHENISLVNIKKYIKNGFVRDRIIDEDAAAMKKLLDIKITDFKAAVNKAAAGRQISSVSVTLTTTMPTFSGNWSGIPLKT